MISDRKPIKRQQGVATLMTSLVILVVLTVVVLYAGKTGVMEQNVTANQYRAAQALAAANAALDYGVAYYVSGDGGVDQVTGCSPQNPASTAADGTADWDFDCRKQDTLSHGGNTLPWEMFYCDPENTGAAPSANAIADATANCGTAPLGVDNVAVVGVGYSDDRTARRVIVQEVASMDVIGQGPNSPLSAKGGVGVTGNWRIINRHSNLTIWTGIELNTSGNSANSFGPIPGYPYASEQAKGACPSNKSDPGDALKMSGGSMGFNADVYDYDPNLQNASNDAFFTAFFNFPPGEMEAIAKESEQYWDLADGNPDFSEVNGGVVWIDVPAGQEFNLSADLGSPAPTDASANPTYSPVFLIVNGDMRAQGFNLTGVIYIRGDWVNQGNPNMRGAAIVEGVALDGAGTPTVCYDPYAFDMGPPPGLALLSQGTWRDW